MHYTLKFVHNHVCNYMNTSNAFQVNLIFLIVQPAIVGAPAVPIILMQTYEDNIEIKKPDELQSVQIQKKFVYMS